MPFHDVSTDIRINYTIHTPAPPESSSTLAPASSPPTGPKPWVVLINGLADPQGTWAAQVPAFTRAGYTVLTYDNRGVGESSRPTATTAADGDGAPPALYTAEDMAADLRSLVVALKVPTPYHVMGVSMGGMIAQTYALKYCVPDDSHTAAHDEILTLTLACTYAAPGPFCSRMFALWRDMAVKMSVNDVMRDVALWAFTRDFFTDESRKAELQEMERDMAGFDDQMGLPSYLAQLNVITEFDTTAEVPRLGRDTGLHGQASGADVGGGGVRRSDVKNVIVLAGEEDILIPVALSRELHGLIEGSIWRTTRGGHACMWEFPDEFNQVCLGVWAAGEIEIGG